MEYTCDECNENKVEVGDASPSLVLCKGCNGGEEAYNDVYAGCEPIYFEELENQQYSKTTQKEYDFLVSTRGIGPQ